MTNEFKNKVHIYIETYIKSSFQGAKDRFARYYAITIYGKVTKITSIKEMLIMDYVFTEEDIKNLSKVMENPHLLEAYYVDVIKDTNNKLKKINGDANSTDESVKGTISKNIVGIQDIANAVQTYLLNPAETPMLIFCDNREYIEYIISIAGIKAVKMYDGKNNLTIWTDYRDRAFNGFANKLQEIAESPYDTYVGLIEIGEDSTGNSVHRTYLSHKGIINDVVKKHFILIVECPDDRKRARLFAEKSMEPYVISCKSDQAALDKINDIRKHPENGMGWGYGNLLSEYNVKYLQTPQYAKTGDYLCWHPEYGVTLNWGEAVAKRVTSVVNDSYRSFASILPKEEIELKKVGNDLSDDSRLCLGYVIDLYEIRRSGGGKRLGFSWYVTEFQRAKQNTADLVEFGCNPAVYVSKYYKKLYPELLGKWYLPSLVELVVAKKELEPGLYWSSSISQGCNLIYDAKNDKVIEVSDPKQKAWAVPFIIVKK